MNLAGNLVINLYSIALLIIVYFQALKQVEKGSLQYKIFMMMVEMSILLLTLDILSRFDSKPGTGYVILSQIGNFMIFSLNLSVGSLWLVYVYDQVFHEERKIKKLIMILVTLNCLNLVMVILSQYFGWFYYFDSNYIYHRGPLFLLPVVLLVILLLISYCFIILNRKKMEKKQSIALAFFSVPPFLGIILQVLFYGISLVLNSLVLSLLIVYLNIQNANLYTDYLTGVNNRKKLDLYLRDKIRMSSYDKTFSAIMLDLNNFKQINDTWGHDAGDDALRKSAKLLNSCLRIDDFVARFGGDEFCIILNITDNNELEKIVRRINKCFEHYNRTSKQPYKLGFSVGYTIYDYHSDMKLEEFQKQLDILLYQNKQLQKKMGNIACT